MSSDVTRILSTVDQRDPAAAEKLLPLVYDELRQLAAAKLRQEKPGHTLQATALVHEAYLRVIGGDAGRAFHNRAHFFAAAAEAIRRILIDNARRKNSQKAGGERQRVDLIEVDAVAIQPASPIDVLALEDALVKLETKDPRKAVLIKLRFFAGLTNEQAADVLGISASSADNDWAYARAWLRLEMEGRPGANAMS
jgi:RNA polymerase sigma factor (TIGR02999 family)